MLQIFVELLVRVEGVLEIRMETIINKQKHIYLMKRGTLTLILLTTIILINFISAVGDIGIVKQGDCIDLYNYCPTCSYINLTAIQYPNQTIETMNLAMVKTGKNYIYNFCNTSKLGEYSYTTCGDKAGILTCEDVMFKTTSSGDNYTTSDSITNVVLIIFFFLIILGIYILNKNIDFNKWNNSIISKYENKNYIKLVLSSITYNIMKNSFIIYYILILPILLLIMNIAYTSSNVSMIQFIPALIVIYLVGFVIIGIYFFGYVQEWLMNLLEMIKDLDWGIMK